MAAITVPRRVRRTVAVVLVAALVYMAVLPLLPGTDDAQLFTLTLMLTTIGVSISWNLTGGFTGYVDFGHAVWFGIGAYVTAIMMSLQSDLVPQQLPLVPSIIAGAVVASIIAYGVGRMTMRLSGPYFSIAMLGFFVFMREVVRISRPLTNGGTGLTLPPSIDRPLWYYVQLVFVLVLLALSWWLRRSRFGAGLIAIREDEIGAEMRGIDTERNKVLIFSFSAFVTGVFGGMWAYQNTFVDPDIAFFETRTIDAVMSTMLGGLGTVAGPVLGSVVLYWLREVLWANFLDFHLIVQGVLLGLIVLYLPRGLIGLVSDAGSGNTWLQRVAGRGGSRSSTFAGMTSLLDGDDHDADDHEGDDDDDDGPGRASASNGESIDTLDHRSGAVTDSPFETEGSS